MRKKSSVSRNAAAAASVKSAKPGKPVNEAAVKKVVAVVGCLIGIPVLVVETWAFIVRLIPKTAMLLWQAMDVQVTGGDILLTNMTLGDTVQLFVGWGLPVLVCTVILCCLQWVFMKSVFGKLRDFVRNAFGNKGHKNPIKEEASV